MAGSQVPQNPNGVTSSLGLEEERQWPIHYSRFFRFPCLPLTCPDLRALAPRRRRKYHGGMWVSSSSSMASLKLIIGGSYGTGALIVSFLGRIYEAHYISTLLFYWPQVACQDHCPVAGSRVVFASYKDSLGQVQKIAIRFSESSDAETFMSCLKESLKNSTDVGLAGYKFGSDVSPPIEHNFSNGDYERDTNGFSFENPALNHEPPEQPMSEAREETLPPSFVALLSDSCTNTDEATCFSKGVNAAEQPKIPEAFYLKSQMACSQQDKCDRMGCAAGSSFHEMLSNIEMVLYELGGDLAL